MFGSVTSVFVCCCLFQNLLVSKLLPQREKEAVSEIRSGAASLSVMDDAYIDQSVSENVSCVCAVPRCYLNFKMNLISDLETTQKT